MRHNLFRRVFFVLPVFAVTFAGAASSETLWERLFGRKDTLSARVIGGSNLPVPVPGHLQSIIAEAAAETRIDPNLLAAVMFQESRFNERAVSHRGAQGLMQLMPRTARYLGVNDSFNPEQNVRGGARYLAEMFEKFDGDLEWSLAAYNAGPTAVAQRGPGATDEAVKYVKAIKRFYSPSQPRPWLGATAVAAAR